MEKWKTGKYATLLIKLCLAYYNDMNTEQSEELQNNHRTTNTQNTEQSQSCRTKHRTIGGATGATKMKATNGQLNKVICISYTLL